MSDHPTLGPYPLVMTDMNPPARYEDWMMSGWCSVHHAFEVVFDPRLRPFVLHEAAWRGDACWLEYLQPVDDLFRAANHPPASVVVDRIDPHGYFRFNNKQRR